MGCAEGSQRGGLHPRPAGRTRHDGRRARHPIFGRRKTTILHRPRPPEKPAAAAAREATSALDNTTEKLVQHALDRLRANWTSFVIAHRLSTIREADLICVLDQGELVDQGRHKQLLAQGGRYARILEGLAT
jgi:ABC-type oligopeptide transport system ATPase subunit